MGREPERTDLDPVTNFPTLTESGFFYRAGGGILAASSTRVPSMRVRLALIVALTAVSCGASGQIFRTVDANGNVVFTDIAPVDRSGQTPSTAVTVPPTNTVPAPAAPAARANDAPPAPPAVYTAVSVVSPNDGDTIRENAGNVRIETATTPPLRADHRLVLILNGSPSAVEAVNGVFQLSNVDRGSHTVSVRVVDRDGGTIMDSRTTTFHLMRATVSPTTPVPLPRPTSAN